MRNASTRRTSRYSGSTRSGYAMSGLSGEFDDIEFPSYGLRTGSNGADVIRLQTMLGKVGLPVKIDGVFGQETLAAVYAYQKRKGLPNANLVGIGFWTLISRESGMTKGATTATPVPAQQPQAPAAPAPVTVPQNVQQAVQQATQQAPTPPANTGGGDFFTNAVNWVGGAVKDVGNFVTQNKGTIQQAQQTAKDLGITLPGQQQQQVPTNYVMQNSGATPPTLSPAQAEAIQKAQGGAVSKAGSAPEGTMFLTAENPFVTAARYAVPAGLGVGAGYGLHLAQQKPNLAISILGGAAVAVGTYFIGDKVFPFTPEVIQP